MDCWCGEIADSNCPICEISFCDKCWKSETFDDIHQKIHKKLTGNACRYYARIAYCYYCGVRISGHAHTCSEQYCRLLANGSIMKKENPVL